MAYEYREEIADPLIWKMLRIVRKLLPISDLDQLLKAGVELPRQELGVERCALWLLNPDGTMFHGTWGTDNNGNTTKEHDQTCLVADLEGTLSRPFQQLEGWILRKDVDRLTWTPDGHHIEGTGWNTIIPLTGPEGNVGAFFQDAAITNSVLDPHLQDLMSIYCSILGQLAGRRLAEKREFILSHGLEQVLSAADELMTYDDLDTLHRRIVELAREGLGVVRCGLMIPDPENPKQLRGTWGTDWDGNTTDEHQGIDEGLDLDATNFSEVSSRHWLVRQPFRLSWFEPDGSRVVCAEGWNAVHFLMIKDRFLGQLCSDPGKSGEPFDPRKMEVLTTYCDLAARILDRHQTQAGLRIAMEAAEQGTKAKSEFLASMSHEIRTPLAGVLGLLRMSLRDRGLGLQTKEILSKALTNAESLLDILNGILDYSKIEAGKLVLESIDFTLSNLVETALSVFSDQAHGRNLSFGISIEPSVPPTLRGDPTRLRQILVNLVGNAIKFTERGFVNVAVQGTSEVDNACILQFTVEDSGIGIPEDVLPRLFSKFEQADMSTTRRFGGTGLGLAISKQLVDAMGGQIEVQSVWGRGTTFVVQIPFAIGSDVPTDLVPQLRPHTHRLRVLCAEDYPTTQLIVRTLLEDSGHSVDLVDNGRSALELLATRDYDLVFLDGRMPVMDGLETIRHLRLGQLDDLVFRDPKIRTVAFTANVSSQDRRAFLEAGMDDFLAKPIDEREFHLVVETAITKLLEAGRFLQPLVHASPSSLDALFELSASDEDSVWPGSIAPPPASPIESRLEEIFRATLPDRLQELNSALNRGDLAELGRLFHGLRGSAGYVHAQALADQANDLERLSDQGELDEVHTRLPRFFSELSVWLTPPQEAS